MRAISVIATMLVFGVTVVRSDSAQSAKTFEIGSLGKFRVSKVEEGDRFPPNCEPGDGCQPAKPGYKVVVLWVEPVDGRDPGNVGIDLFDATESLRLVAADGSATERFSAGLIQDRLLIAFTPESADSGFVLKGPHLPDGLRLSAPGHP